MATIRKHGNRWQAQVRRLGFPSQSKSFLLREDAVRWSREQEIALDRGGGTASLTKQEAEETVGQLLERYGSEVTPKKKSAHSESYHLRVLKRHPIAKVQVRYLTGANITELRDNRLQSVAPATVRKEMGLLIRVLKVAQDEWSISVPVLATRLPKLPKVTNARERRLTEVELLGLQDAFKRLLNPYVQLVVIFTLATGMRRSETLSLRWSNLDLKLNTAFLSDTKNGQHRVVPLSLLALSSLPKRTQKTKDDDLVFPISPNALRLSWERLKVRAGIVDFRFHDLRHEAISRFFELGLSVPEVSLISGHKDARMLFRYTHLRATDVAAKLHKLAGGDSG